MINANKATLSPEDCKTFFRLFIPLLDFTNQKYEISEYLSEDLRMGCPDKEDLIEVAAVLWANTEVICEYIEYIKKQNLADDNDIRILESWRHPVSGRFILERHLAKGSVFLDAKSQNVYLVKGLTESWGDMLCDFKTPILLEANLIPFGDYIISDDLVNPYNIIFSPGARSDFREFYMNAKQNSKIITSL